MSFQPAHFFPRYILSRLIAEASIFVVAAKAAIGASYMRVVLHSAAAEMGTVISLEGAGRDREASNTS